MITIVALFKQASGCRSLVIVTLLLIKGLYVVAKGITCKTGAAKAYKVPISYTIREQFVTPFGCFHGFSTESKSWPGTPENLIANISAVNGRFQLSWKPPDDSSASTMTGFLLTMYVEETGRINSFGPSVCYIVNSKTGLGNKPADEVMQDAVFHVDCEIPRKLNVKVKVISLPVPIGRHFKDASIDVMFKGTTTMSSTTRPNPVTKMLTEPPADELESTSMFAFSLGALFVCVIVSTVVVFLLCKTRCSSHGITRPHSTVHTGLAYFRNWNNGSCQPDSASVHTAQVMHQHDLQLISISAAYSTCAQVEFDGMSRNTQRMNKHYISSTTKETSDDIREGRTENIKRDDKETYEIPDTDYTAQENFDNLCSAVDSSSDTVSYTYHYDRGEVPIPQPFRTQLEMFNLES